MKLFARNIDRYIEQVSSVANHATPRRAASRQTCSKHTLKCDKFATELS